MADATIENIDQDEIVALFGSRDENLRLLRETIGLKVTARNGVIALQGTDDEVDKTMRVLERMRSQYRSRRPVTLEDVRMFLAEVTADSLPVNGETGSAGGDLPSREENVAFRELASPLRRIKPKTSGQARYVEAMSRFDLTLCDGPAGTGKTYLAVAAAMEALQRKQIKRIVLARPAVEAGEKLGYLPGDMQAKVHPYLRPLLDALRDMIDFHQLRAFMENDVVEISPLAYMRGRTLNDSFVILDEGQNTTIPQMKMFLTRMGMGSKIVVTGDGTQVDLPPNSPNGLTDAIRRLSVLESVAVVRMEKKDIVRHPLVQAIVNAYETSE